jgi:FkbM family methyltransferase
MSQAEKDTEEEVAAGTGAPAGGKASVKAERRRQRIQELKERSERLHRSILAPRVLKGMLPIRAAGLARRSSLPESRDREARFRTTSASYAAVAADDRAFAGSTRIVDLDSLRWWVPLLQPDDEAAVQRYLTHQDFPYRAMLQTREAAIGGVMFDIGANIGRMSIPRVILGDVTVAYCAEPDLLNYTCLVRYVRDNDLAGLVLPDRIAIGSEDGSVELQLARRAGGHRVVDTAANTEGSSVSVPSLTLDSWIARLGVAHEDISFVKVDVQGSEMHVLRGARKLLSHRHVAWQIEIDTVLLKRRGASAEDLFGEVQLHFTHFVDLNRKATGARVHPTSELANVLSYASSPGNRTDILAFNLHPASAAADQRAPV